MKQIFPRHARKKTAIGSDLKSVREKFKNGRVEFGPIIVDKCVDNGLAHGNRIIAFAFPAVDRTDTCRCGVFNGELLKNSVTGTKNGAEPVFFIFHEFDLIRSGVFRNLDRHGIFIREKVRNKIVPSVGR